MDTKKLRQKILDLAIHGKLVPQNPNDEPASVLLERIRAEKERLIKEGKIKKSKASKTSDTPHYENRQVGKANVPFEVPDGWCWCKLGDIVSYLGGFAYKSSTYVSFSDWQVIRIGNVKNDNLILDSQPIFVSEELGNDTQKYMIKTDDILFSMTGTKGKRDYFFSVVVPELNRNLLLNQRVGCLRKFSKDINIHYLCLALKSQYVLDAIFSTETGNVSQGNIGSESTLNLDIALPPLSEQIRIVEKVKKWFTLIAQIEQGKTDLQVIIKQTKSKILDLAIHGKLVPQDPNDEPALELLKRINPKAEITCDNGQYGKIPVGWYRCQFGEYLDVRDGTHDSPKYVEKGYPFVTSKNLSHGKIDFDTTKFISEEDHIKFSQRSFVEDGDILFAMIGSIGNPVLIVKDREFSIKNVALFKPYDRKNTYMEYVLYYLLYIQETLKQDAKGGMQPFIPLNYFRKDLHIPLPPIEEQHRIVTKIEELFTSLDNIQKALEV